MNQKLVKAVLLLLAALSLSGSIVFAVGCGLVYKRLAGSSLPIFLRIFLHHSWEEIMSPMWLFATANCLLYPILVARIITFPDTVWRKVSQSFLMLVSVFYIMGAGTTLLLGVLLSLANKNEFFGNLLRLHLERAETVPMFGGVIMSVFFYTVLMFVIPLTEIKHRQKYYYELVESTK